MSFLIENLYKCIANKKLTKMKTQESEKSMYLWVVYILILVAIFAVSYFVL